MNRHLLTDRTLEIACLIPWFSAAERTGGPDAWRGFLSFVTQSTYAQHPIDSQSSKHMVNQGRGPARGCCSRALGFPGLSLGALRTALCVSFVFFLCGSDSWLYQFPEQTRKGAVFKETTRPVSSWGMTIQKNLCKGGAGWFSKPDNPSQLSPGSDWYSCVSLGKALNLSEPQFSSV